MVVPFYNEEDSIPTLRRRLEPVLEALGRRWSIQLVLVDDGSRDSTHESLFKHFGDLSAPIRVTILRHGVNRGIGCSLRTGFDAAEGDIVCTLDSDCTYAPEELPGMIEMLFDSRADIVTASPYHPVVQTGNAKNWRLFLSNSASQLYSFQVREKLYCYTSLFRVYRRKWCEPDVSLFCSTGFLGVTELLVAAIYRGAKIVEYPIPLKTREAGQSKMRVMRVTAGHLWLMAKIAWVNLRFRVGQLGPNDQFGFGSRYRLWHH